jgi:hypothetical protein
MLLRGVTTFRGALAPTLTLFMRGRRPVHLHEFKVLINTL